jgi:hypothetical protein
MSRLVPSMNFIQLTVLVWPLIPRPSVHLLVSVSVVVEEEASQNNEEPAA